MFHLADMAQLRLLGDLSVPCCLLPCPSELNGQINPIRRWGKKNAVVFDF